MKRCIIICPLWQGERREELIPGPEDLLLCADAGLYAALKHGLRPDLAVGDFDTLPPPEDGPVPLRLLPVRKDDTDLGACIAEGRRRGFDSFLLAGCIGGRLDHTLAMLQLMADCALRGEQCTAIDAVNTVTVLAPGRYALAGEDGRLLSLLSFGERVTGVTLRGAEWQLERADLTQRFPLGISNRVTAEAAELSFDTGLLCVCRSVNETWMSDPVK